jgi:hypothetical protein
MVVDLLIIFVCYYLNLIFPFQEIKNVIEVLIVIGQNRNDHDKMHINGAAHMNFEFYKRIL